MTGIAPHPALRFGGRLSLATQSRFSISDLPCKPRLAIVHGHGSPSQQHQSACTSEVSIRRGQGRGIVTIAHLFSVPRSFFSFRGVNCRVHMQSCVKMRDRCSVRSLTSTVDSRT
jgi:hypothetical protein